MPCQLFDAKSVASVLTMRDTLDACEVAFRDWGAGEVVCPTKITLELGEDAEWPPYRNGLNAMPAYIHSMKSAGIKCVGGSLNNPSWGLPYIIALILLFDPETGVFKAILDGEQITNYRTGAQAAVAARHIWPGREIDLGIYGTGAQGRTQLMAFAEAFDIRRVRVYDIDASAAERYAREMGAACGVEIETMRDPERVAAESEIIVSVTHSREKFLKKEWVAPGKLVMPMGSFTECEDDLLLSADRVYVDSIGQTLHRGALKSVVDQGRFGEPNIAATIGEVVCGKVDGRIKPDERVVCIPIGTGAMDVAVATTVYRKALEKGMGQSFVFNESVEVEPKRS